MATSNTPRRKAATEAVAEAAALTPAKKKPAAKASQPAARPAAKSVKTATTKAVSKAAGASTGKAAGKSTGKSPSKSPSKSVTQDALTTAAKPSAEAASKSMPRKPADKQAAAEKPAAKKAAAKKPAAKNAAAKNAAVEEAVAKKATAKKTAAATEAMLAEPVKKAGRKPAAELPEPVLVPEKTGKPSRKAAPAAEAVKPARTGRKRATPAVAAPVAALVAEVAAALEQQPEAEPPAAARKRTSSRAKAAAAESAVLEVPQQAEASEPPQPPAAKPARKPRPARNAKAPAEALQDDATAAAATADGSHEDAAMSSPPGPDWRWHKAQAGLFGLYTIQSAEGEPLAELNLQGSAIGQYRCSCAEFADSEEGCCAHGPWLVEQLVAGREGQAARLAAGPETPWSELGLSAGWERRLVWRVGQGASPALRAVAQACADEQGRFMAALEGQVLPALLQAAAEEGHELRVGVEVWQQLALSADAGDRVERLALSFEQGLASPALHALLTDALPEPQWEAALFAVCAGRALLADESPLPQRPAAVAAARLWQTQFDVGLVTIVAPEASHAAWREDVLRLLGAWPEHWSLLEPTALQQAEACELLIVDAIETLAEFLPALQRLAAPHLLLIAQSELLGTALLGPLVAWIDEARRGPYAALRRLGADAGKRQQREVLETVMLARRRRDLVAGLPAQLLAQVQTHWLRVPAEATPELAPAAAELQTLQRLHQRWSRVGSLSAGEQLQLQQALLRLRQGAGLEAERMGEARAAALLGLLPSVVPGLAERVVVFAQQDAALRPLALALQDLGLPLANLRQHQSAEVRALELQAWSDGEASVLLATDAACAGLDLRLAGGAAIVHADLCWNPALMSQRLARMGSEGADVPAWALVLEAGFDPAVLAAHAQEETLPSGLQDGEAGAIPFLAGADLAGFMAAVGRALAAFKAP